MKANIDDYKFFTKFCCLQGLCESALDFSKSVLRPGGIFLCKLWDGYGTKGNWEVFLVTVVDCTNDQYDNWGLLTIVLIKKIEDLLPQTCLSEIFVANGIQAIFLLWQLWHTHTHM